MQRDNITIIDNVKVEFDFAAISRKMRARNIDKAEKILAELAQQALPLARPRAAARLCGLEIIAENQVSLEGVQFTSPLLVKKFGGLGRVFPYLATEGHELAEWGRSLTGAERLFANALENAAMKMAESTLENLIVEKFGLGQVSALNPGSLLIWPITQQAPLFKLLSPLPEELGIGLA